MCVCALLCVLCSIPWHYLPWVHHLVPKILSFTSNFNVSDLLCNNPAIWAWWWRHKQFHSIQSGNEIALKMSVHEVQCSGFAGCNVQLYSEHKQLQLQNAARSCAYRSPTNVALLLGLCTALQLLMFKKVRWQWHLNRVKIRKCSTINAYSKRVTIQNVALAFCNLHLIRIT